MHHEVFEERTPAVHEEKTGLGDVELLGGWDAFSWASRWRLTLAAGGALPTGEHEVQPFVDEGVPTPLQLGSGTFDPILGVTLVRRLGAAGSVEARGGARLAVMENMHDYRPASLYEVGVGGMWGPLWERLGLGLHAEWSHVTHVEVGGVEAPNTGRDIVYVVPAVHLRAFDSLWFGATVRIPAYLHVNETQFAEGFLLAVRLAWRTPPLFRGADG